MNHPAVKKAKNKILEIVFSRTALVLLLILLQLGAMFVLSTILRDYAVYVYSLELIAQILIVVYIINDKSCPDITCTWMLLILIFPVFGCLFYVYVKLELGTRMFGKRLCDVQMETWPYMKQQKEIVEELQVSKPANANLARYMANQLHYPTYRNTKAMYFSCGEEKFPELLKQLKTAQKYIFLEYFIVAEGYMWESILEILKQKVAEGVEVRFMYDGMCSISLLPYKYPEEIQRYGIICKMFSPIQPVLSTVQNNRDHRKICVIDGKVGFTGGINLADEYINKKERFGYWKDTAIMLQGDAVQSLTMMFLQMWNATELLPEQYESYLTDMSTELKRELGFVIPYADSPYDHENVGEEVYCHILNHAKKYVHIMTPYLILDREMLDALCRAAKSEIDVKIIMPHIPDKWYAFAVAKTYYKELIEGGVQIYEYTPGFVHAKIFVSDDDTATVGSINLDFRSLYLHFENGVFIYDNPEVQKVEEDFQNTLAKCHKVTVTEVRNRGILMKTA